MQLGIYGILVISPATNGFQRLKRRYNLGPCAEIYKYRQYALKPISENCLISDLALKPGEQACTTL
jgi:hypothetical protein